MNKLEAFKQVKLELDATYAGMELDGEYKAISLLLDIEIEKLENVSRETSDNVLEEFLKHLKEIGGEVKIYHQRQHGRNVVIRNLQEFAEVLKNNSEKAVKHIEADFMAKHCFGCPTEVYLKTPINIGNQDIVFIDDVEYVSRETLNKRLHAKQEEIHDLLTKLERIKIEVQ